MCCKQSISIFRIGISRWIDSVEVVLMSFNTLIISLTIWCLLLLPESENCGCATAAAATDVINCGGNSTRMSINCTLTPSQNSILMKSPNGTFLMSFVPLNATNSLYYLAISFAVSLSTHPVWTANRNSPVTSTAKLTLDSTGNLILYDPTSGSSSSSPLWSSNTSNIDVLEAQLLDTGSLVLITSASNSKAWQSFDYPTDTLLPGQNFSSKLFSPSGASDLSTGGFSLSFSSDRSMLQLSNNRFMYAYHNVSEVLNPGYFSYNELGNFFNLQTIPVISDQGFSSSLRKLTLDKDGNLHMYTWDMSSSEWNEVWIAIADICATRQNICGDYGICIYKPQPACVCPPGMSPVSSYKISSGCQGNIIYKTSDTCDTANPGYFIIDNIDFPENDFDNFIGVSEETCKARCSNDCSCIGAVYWRDGSGHCWLKSLLQNGHTSTDGKFRAFLRYSESFNENSLNTSAMVSNNATYWSYNGLWQNYNINLTVNPSSNISNIPEAITDSKTQKRVIICLVVAFVAVFIVYNVVMAIVVHKYRKTLKYTKLQTKMDAVSGSPVAFTYQELEIATSKFSQKLGEGAFGSVYKGKLPRGNMVAVKKLECLSQLHGEKQFRAEIATIGRVHHFYLLRLLGFCVENKHRLLVYDYMENGSLDKILFNRESSVNKLVLDWETRYKICLGVARGISYLHHECSECIVHCDIKPQNILLDQRYLPKVADFGVAYLYSRDHTMKMTTVRGTRGYMAPEWLSNLPITTKADVYSYGMLAMEIVSGKSNFKEITELNNEHELEPDNGNGWCFPVWAFGKTPQQVLDPRFLQSRELLDGVDWIQVESVMKVAFLCIQRDHHARPSMATVVQMLEGILHIPELEGPPSFLPGTGIHFLCNLSSSSAATTAAGSLISSTASTSNSILSAR